MPRISKFTSAAKPTPFPVRGGFFTYPVPPRIRESDAANVTLAADSKIILSLRSEYTREEDELQICRMFTTLPHSLTPAGSKLLARVSDGMDLISFSEPNSNHTQM